MVIQAYEDVRSDKTPTNWLIVGYGDEKGETMKLVATGINNAFLILGTGGFDEFKKNLKADEAYFGYVRMVVGNDELVFQSSHCSLEELNFFLFLGVELK